MYRKTFQHGGSRAINLPASFIANLPSDCVKIKEKNGRLIIEPTDNQLNNMELDPLFAKFIEALFADAISNPEKLKDLKDVWDDEWNDLLEGVSDDED